MNRLLALGLLAILLGAAAPLAHADSESIQFFQDIHVPAGGQMRDAVCFFCSVRVEGNVTGDIVVFVGDVRLSGDAQHDVVNVLGSIRAADGASIENDVTGVFSMIRLGEHVTVGRDLVSVFGSLRAPASVEVTGDRTVVPAWIFFGPVLLFLLFAGAIVHEYRSYRKRLVARGYVFPPRA